MWGAENWGLVAFGGFMAFLANVLYMWGGTEMKWGGQKWLRRYLGSFVLATSAAVVAIVISQWDWRYLLMLPCLAIGFSRGYGASSTKDKILRRSLFALGVLSACVVGAWIAGWTASALLVLGTCFVVGLASVLLGVFNPFTNAPLEQFIICQLLTMFVPFWAFVG